MADSYKGESAVTLDGGGIRAVVLPRRGAKIASLYSVAFGRELLWQIPGAAYASAAVPGGRFGPEDSSGFDDMFPTISACDYEDSPWNKAAMPDHGELWSMPWSFARLGAASVELSVHGRAFPYVFTKRIEARDSAIRIDYTLANLSDSRFSCIWAAHPLFATRPGMRIKVPSGCDSIINAFETPAMGKPGSRMPYPMHGSMDLSRVSTDTGACRKFYFADRLAEGWCSLVDPDSSMEIRLSFPAWQVPYLGIWVNEGGWADQNNIGIEPALGAMDSPPQAARYGMGNALEPRETKNWYLEIAPGTMR